MEKSTRRAVIDSLFCLPVVDDREYKTGSCFGLAGGGPLLYHAVSRVCEERIQFERLADARQRVRK